MGTQFASGKHAIAMCDRCGAQFKLKELKYEVVKQRRTNLLVCPSCWNPDHPQLMLGTFPVYDPQAIRDARRDNTYDQSRDIEWSWNPVGGGQNYASSTPDSLLLQGAVGTVTVSTS
jgi:hypothetical protein